MSDVAESIQTFHGGCPHDCPDTCSMQFKVKDGRLIGVSGNPDHPMTLGGLCVKLKDYEKTSLPSRPPSLPAKTHRPQRQQAISTHLLG